MRIIKSALLALGMLFILSAPASQARADSFDPCIPQICDHVERLIENAKDQFVQSALDALPNPKHVKQVVDCLNQLLNLAMNIGLVLMWPDFSAILSRIIDAICQQIMSKWDAIISQLSANFQLPNIPLTIFGTTYTDWIGGGISVGVTRGSGVPGGSMQLELVSPVDRTYIRTPGFNIPN